jgi:uncharacterized protein YigA (DUF484 family)
MEKVDYKKRCKELKWENDKLKKQAKSNEKVYYELMGIVINLIKDYEEIKRIV